MTYDPNDAKSIFLHVVELSSATERESFLERACAGKPELKARVESLLKTALDPDSLLDQPVAELGATHVAQRDALSVPLEFLHPSDVTGSLGRLGGYEVLEVIGRGGMGVVLRALDSKLNRVVAIKVLAPELASQPQARKRFLREAQAAAAVSHDHVVTIHAVDDGAGGDNKVPLLVMECIVGQSLQQKIDKVGALGLKEILRIGMQIASGLAAAHKQGLVHRDIKPANILLENGIERVKITDFGLARATDDVGITQSGQIAGTPQYMSPEQAQGHPVDQRSDVFSLGSVLYTMCTGRPAFRADSAVAVLRRVCDDTPRPIGELNAELPDWLIAIIGRLMAKKPEDRYQTAREVALVLEQALAHVQQPEAAPRPVVLVIPGNAQQDGEQESRLSAVVISLLTLGFLTVVGLFGAEVSGAISSETRSLTMTFVIASLMGLLLLGRLVQVVLPRLSNSSHAGHSGLLASAKRKHASSAIAPPSGTLSRAWHDWWSERDRWITSSVQTVLILVYLLCMICFISFSSRTGVDAEGRTTLVNQLGVPSPWSKFEVYPEPHSPFRFGFYPFTSSVLIGLLGCVVFYAWWRIEQVRDPKVSKWSGPSFMLGIWGVAGVFGVGICHWQGYAALNRPRVAVTPAPSENVQASGTIALPIPGGNPFDLWKEAVKNGVAFPPPAIAPFNAEQAKKHQEEWATFLGISAELTDKHGVKFVLIPPGEFQMGFTQSELETLTRELKQAGAGEFDQFAAATSGPQHPVRITKPFYMSAHEVTVAEYRRWLEETRYVPTAEQLGGQKNWTDHLPAGSADNLPAVGVSWTDADTYCVLRSEREGITFRLPTEAEWEYSCRAGSTALWSFGNDVGQLTAYAITPGSNVNGVQPVGSRQPNAFGLFDMHGNAEEWCRDWHIQNFYANSPMDDPARLDTPQDKNSGRVCRGGGFGSLPWQTRSASRRWDYPSTPVVPRGFRIVISGDLKKAIPPTTAMEIPRQGGPAERAREDDEATSRETQSRQDAKG